MLAKRVQTIQSSPTFAQNALVKQMKAEGKDVINLGIGEPDFPTPANIKEAAIKAIQNNFSYYTEVPGILPLREAIVEKFKRDNDITYAPNQVIVGAGSKQLLYNAFQVLCNPGDEVLVPIPTWATYIEQVKLAEATPVFIPLLSPYKLTAKDVEEHISKKTKVLLLNSPSNPTGAMIDADELQKIADLAVRHDFWIVSDEIYEKIVYGQTHVSIASLNLAIKERTITINGVSKAYAMTGWRVGFAAGPLEAIQAMGKMQDQQTSNPSSIAQMAALEAISGDQSSVVMMTGEFKKRRDVLLSSLNKTGKLKFPEPEGAFYLFVSLEDILGNTYSTSMDWCQALLQKELVAVIAGEAFNAPGHFRISYASSMDSITKAVEKINHFVQNS